MTKQITRITKGVITGMVIGGTAGVTLACMAKKPQKNNFRHRAANALDTVGTIMQNLADFTR